MWKLASKTKLRIAVVGAGLLSPEQLWSANMNDLMNTEEALQAEVAKFGTTSRRLATTQTKAVEETKLKLAIITDVLDTREKEATDRAEALENKRHNAKIDDLIAKKKESALENLSIEDLEKLRRG